MQTSALPGDRIAICSHIELGLPRPCPQTVKHALINSNCNILAVSMSEARYDDIVISMEDHYWYFYSRSSKRVLHITLASNRSSTLKQYSIFSFLPIIVSMISIYHNQAIKSQIAEITHCCDVHTYLYILNMWDERSTPYDICSLLQKSMHSRERWRDIVAAARTCLPNKN